MSHGDEFRFRNLVCKKSNFQARDVAEGEKALAAKAHMVKGERLPPPTVLLCTHTLYNNCQKEINYSQD